MSVRPYPHSGQTMIEFKKWIARKATPLLIVYMACQTVPLEAAWATIIKDLRTGDNPGFVRLVMEFDRPLTPAPSLTVDQNNLKITLPGIDNLPATPAAIGGITQLVVFRDAHGARIETNFAFAPVDIKTFALTGPHRFIIDAYRPVAVSAEPRVTEAHTDGPAMSEPSGLPEPYHPPAESISAWSSRPVARAATDAHRSQATDGTRSANAQRNQFQQRLIAALIGVTSIIVVLLFFLMRIGSTHPGPRQHSWMKRLPSTHDPNIAAIDSKIQDHLTNYDRL